MPSLTADDIDGLLGELADGNSAVLSSRIYGREALSEGSVGIAVKLLTQFRLPAGGEKLRCVRRHRSGRYELLIVQLPSNGREGVRAMDALPLLVAMQHGALRIVGLMLPWDDLIPTIESEREQWQPLALAWITWVEKHRARRKK